MNQLCSGIQFGIGLTLVKKHSDEPRQICFLSDPSPMLCKKILINVLNGIMVTGNRNFRQTKAAIKIYAPLDKAQSQLSSILQRQHT
jgi:hypothetical protein